MERDVGFIMFFGPKPKKINDEKVAKLNVVLGITRKSFIASSPDILCKPCKTVFQSILELGYERWNPH